ncbi:hypothetical protein AgCh_011315 [Apium graveolens]
MDVSLEDRRILLTYLGDEKVKLLEKLDKLPIGIDDDEAKELLKISDADVYLETQAKVQTALQTEGVEAANKLVYGANSTTHLT